MNYCKKLLKLYKNCKELQWFTYRTNTGVYSIMKNNNTLTVTCDRWSVGLFITKDNAYTDVENTTVPTFILKRVYDTLKDHMQYPKMFDYFKL